jgi:MtN3 and saliva related transmembrane protein
MNAAEVLGTCASVASVTSFTPQAWRVIKTRDTTSLSAPMYGLNVAGFALWIGYGIGIASWQVIATNAICLLFSAFILAMKLLPPKTKDAVADALDPGVKSATSSRPKA